MKKRWIILTIVAVVIVALIVLIKTGVIDTEWQFFAIIAAPFVALFKGIGTLLRGSDEEEELIHRVYEERRRQDEQRHEQTTGASADIDRRVGELMAESENLSTRIDEVRRRREELENQVSNMSDEELGAALRAAFGGSRANG